MSVLKKDVCFQYSFNYGNETSLIAANSVVRSLVDDEIKDLYFINPELKPYNLDGKFIRLDCLLENDEMIVDIEMQLIRRKDFINRTIFYKNRMHEMQMKKGYKYDTLKNVYSIWFCDFIVFYDDYAPITEIGLRRKHNGMQYSDKENIIIVELPKARDINEDSNAIDCWCYVLNHFKPGYVDDKIDLAREKVKAIDMALKDLETMEESRLSGMGEALDEVRKFFDDRDSYFTGKEEGLIEGKTENMTEVVNTLLESMSVDGVAKALKMSVEEVKTYIK